MNEKGNKNPDYLGRYSDKLLKEKKILQDKLLEFIDAGFSNRTKEVYKTMSDIREANIKIAAVKEILSVKNELE